MDQLSADAYEAHRAFHGWKECDLQKCGAPGALITVEGLAARLRDLEAAIEQLEIDKALILARVRELEAGLAWYADLDNYLGHCPAMLSDRGARATAALAERINPTI